MQLNQNNIDNAFRKFVLPSILAVLVSGFYKIVDGYYIGNYSGADSLTAMNMCWPLAGLVSGAGLMLGIGAGAAYSVENGRRNIKLSRQYIVQFYWLVIIVSLCAIAAYRFGSRYFIYAQQPSEDIISIANTYFKIMLIASPFTICRMAVPVLVRNMSAPLMPTVFIAVGALINIAADYIFIAKLGMGLKGAAIATLAGDFSTSVASIIFIHIKNPGIFSGSIKPDIKKAVEILNTGFSVLLKYLYIGVMIFLYNKSLMTYGGKNYVAAYTITGYVITVINIFSEGLANGIQPLISSFSGEGRQELINRVLKKGITLGVTAGIIFSSLVIIFSEHIAGFFTTDKNVTALASSALKISVSLAALDILIYLMVIYFQSIKAGGTATAVSSANMAVRIPLLLILPLFFNVNGIWASIPLSSALVVLTMIIIIKKNSIKLALP